MAIAGVLTGSKKARPAETATLNVATFADNPKASEAARATGINIATAAALLVASVNRRERTTIAARARNGV